MRSGHWMVNTHTLDSGEFQGYLLHLRFGADEATGPARGSPVDLNDQRQVVSKEIE